jgi:hypothetical protein
MLTVTVSLPPDWSLTRVAWSSTSTARRSTMPDCNLMVLLQQHREAAKNQQGREHSLDETSGQQRRHLGGDAPDR